jgi:branched-chain amino acid transport system permease protein
MFLILGAVLLAFICLPPAIPSYVVMLITLSLIYAIAAMSLDLLLGYLGLAALGHAAYFVIGAYTTAILAVRYGPGLGTTLIASIGASIIAAAVLAPLALRAISLYFLMITLSIALCVWGLSMRWVSLTGGDNGIVGIYRPDLGLPWSISNPLPFYYLILFSFLIFLTIVSLLVRSPFGKTLVSIRDSESRMRVLGYDVRLHKYMAYVIAAGFAGGAGCFLTYYNEFISPDSAKLEQCMKLVLMVALGGPGTMVGPLLGAFIITFLENIVSIYTERWLMVLSVVYLVTATYTPRGILGLLARLRKQ